MTWDIELNYEFSDTERDRIRAELESLNTSPYKHYPAFREQVCVLRQSQVWQRFAGFLESVKRESGPEHPLTLIKNSPMDKNLPLLGNRSPIYEKYRLKQTFVVEGFLEAVAQFLDTPPIGYLNVNHGDVFQDIYPIDNLSGSQSQKSDKEIFFHKDLANHFVRPDYVNMFSLYNNPINEVFTSFVRNLDLINELSSSDREILGQRVFYTPFDDLTVHESRRDLENADLHPVLDGLDVRYFENRTVSMSEDGERALLRFQETLHRLKLRVFLNAGDVLLTRNNDVTHAKEVIEIRDDRENKKRWIMKTVNVDSLENYSECLIPGTTYLVNG